MPQFFFLFTIWIIHSNSLQYKHIGSVTTIGNFHRGIFISANKQTSDIERDSFRINYLLQKAVKISSKILIQRNNTNTIKTKKLLRLSFKSKIKQEFNLLNNPKYNTAIKYLSLPTSSYSLLNSTLITRIDINTFSLLLPLYEITSLLPIQINAQLGVDLKVLPKPDIGKIEISSGLIYFIPYENKNNQKKYLNNYELNLL
jgi:hypothetical protein